MEDYQRHPIHQRETITGSSSAKMIIRRSVHIFLKHYQYFTTTSALIALPFSLSLLLFLSLIPQSSSSLLTIIYARLHAIFNAATAGAFDQYPASSSKLITLINLKLSQTIYSSLVTLPFTLSFLLITKASIIQLLKNKQSISFTSIINTYTRILQTHIYNLLILFSTNATCFTLFFIALNIVIDQDGRIIHLSNWVFLCFAVFYSIVLANVLVICNLALVISGMEEETQGFMAILKACVLIKGKVSIALSLVIPVNIGLAMVEALFNFRILNKRFVDSSSVDGETNVVALEGLLIAYLYCIVSVLDVIITCLFYESCKVEYDDDGCRCSDLLEVGEFYTSDPQKLKAIG